MLPFEVGAAVIALKTNTPVLPVYLDCKGYKLFHRVKVAAGEPLDLAGMANGQVDSETVAKMTNLLFEKMNDLKESIRNV
jgi:1-acyl-sn-glycerol-3-phosphate acyltransferase